MIMAKAKTEQDVQLAKINASVVKTRVIAQAISRCFYVACGTGFAIAALYFAAQVLNKPAWLELALAVIGAAGPLSFVVYRMRLRIVKLTAERAPFLKERSASFTGLPEETDSQESEKTP
jgi:hypothetical protein